MNSLEKSVWPRSGRTLLILVEVAIFPKKKGVPPPKATDMKWQSDGSFSWKRLVT